MKNATLSLDHPAVTLFRLVPSVEPYPEGVVAVPEQIGGTSFFPGGIGLWREGPAEPTFPLNGVMVLGQDFHSVAGYERSRAAGREQLRDPTWRHLLALLREVPIPITSCFFTNAFMGLRLSTSAIGTFPGWKSGAFVERCRQFFLQQVSVQRPRLLLTLGAHVPRFLAPLSPELQAWHSLRTIADIDRINLPEVSGVRFVPRHKCTVAVLTHPCLRPANVGRREWQGLRGDPAETELLRHAFQEAQRQQHVATA